ncbi:MAG: PAS domain-containing sensor histidine kinase [Elusimicrobiota bacterium]
MTADFLDSIRPLFDCLADGYCVADAQGRLLYANAAVGELLGPAAQAAGETSICELLCKGLGGSCGEVASACPLRVPRGAKDALSVKGRYGPTGRDIRVRCSRVRRHSVENLFLIIEDVSPQAEAGRHKEEWRQMLAHDFRAPLTIMYGVLRTVQDLGVGHALDQSDIDLVEKGARNGRRLDDLIASYLETAQLEDGTLLVHAVPVDVDRMIRELVSEEEAGPRTRGLKLTIGAASMLSALADPKLLHRALTNLIGNALKFTPQGGRIHIQAAASVEDHAVLITVSDNGQGISARDLPHIFDRFYQGESDRKDHGLGLGLNFCRAALLAMGGEITVQSQEGKGSVFTIRLPATVALEVSP